MRRRRMLLLLSCIGIDLTGILFAQENEQNALDLPLDRLLNLQISTAAKYEQTISEAPASVAIVTSEDIERYSYRTLEEVLLSVRGFYVTNDRNYSYLGVRGFSRPTDYNDRILLLLNGHTLNENVYGSALIGTELGIELGAIERLEIVRGPGSVLYGTGAIFAVVNIITKSGAIIDGLKLSAEAGSYGRLHGSAAFGKELDNGMDIFVSAAWAEIKGQDLFFREYDDPSTNYGIAQNLDWDKYYGLLTTITYRGLTLQGIASSREKGIPTGAFGIAFNDDAARSLDQRSLVDLKYDSGISADKNIMVRAYLDHYAYSGTYPYDTNSFDASDGNWMGNELQFRWDLRPNNRITIGAEYKRNSRVDYRYWNADTTYFNQNFPFNVFSLYVQDEYEAMEDLSFTLGIRRDQYSTVGSSTTPRAAIVYRPGRSGALKLLYSEAFRAPNLYEVNYEDPIAGYKSNPALKPEKIRTAEIVWEQRLSEEFLGVASFYHYEMENLIDQTTDPSDSLVQFRNISEVKAAGLELELTARLKAGLRGYMNHSIQIAKDAGWKNWLTNSPRHMTKVGVECPLLAKVYGAAEMLYESERGTVYGTKTASYFLANVSLSTKPLFHHMKFAFLVRNVFDATYQTPGGYEHKQVGITQNRRNFALKVEYRL